MKRNYRKTLQNKALKLFKEICFLRDGDKCRVQRHFPGIRITHAGYPQVDHCFSRSVKQLFTDPSNGTVVCGTCNRAKHYHQKGVDLAIYEIVKLREGEEKFNEMRTIAESLSASEVWKNITWLEEHIKKLEAQLKALKEGV